ncbi:LysR family transcriptional regulator [Actinoallomurus bryophytorum]|uniref:DNA-binding transcriptional LysR family regulator n=1 Tax=Actinoallomurus bryophytorum TaxID=1490222 RepID=A0A543CWT6_9ACTN|nr:LysR family transcriptional regulator [Actinoallomurus bryophytorum]TQM01574.1 DNA-binding transcriptional LysR family regulator [Actinoallomurus bryophytorum]
MLDVRRLSLLREFANRGTVSATAEALHLTGPAVSQQLAVLEREAGVPLLERTGRTLSLTAAGHVLVAHAEVLMGNVAQAESDLAALRGGTLGTVRIGAFPSAARAVVSRLWSATPADGVRQAPSLRLVEQEPELSIAALMRNDVDLAVVHAYTLLPRDLPACDATHLLDDQVVLALHPADAARRGLETGRPARLTEFAESDWLVPGPETSCHEMIQRACGAAGFVVHPIAHATDFSVLTALVEAGAGVALIPRLALPEGPLEISLHPLTRPVTRTVSALTRAGESRRPELRHTLDALQEAAANYLTRAREAGP